MIGPDFNQRFRLYGIIKHAFICGEVAQDFRNQKHTDGQRLLLAGVWSLCWTFSECSVRRDQVLTDMQKLNYRILEMDGSNIKQTVSRKTSFLAI